MALVLVVFVVAWVALKKQMPIKKQMALKYFHGTEFTGMGLREQAVGSGSRLLPKLVPKRPHPYILVFL